MEGVAPIGRFAIGEIALLKRIIRNQQQLLLDQQAGIERQREEIRRQDRVLRGLELLRRSCQ